MRFNTVLLDFCRDLWTYISLGYFRQKIKPGEVGSSTMPHKVNPIDFENAEANLGISSASFAHLADKLPVSRSAARFERFVGIAELRRRHRPQLSGAALHRARPVSRVEVDLAALLADLDGAWEVLAEAIQTIMRKHHVPGAYERLKDLTRGARVSQEDLRAFIDALALPEADKEMLKATQARLPTSAWPRNWRR